MIDLVENKGYHVISEEDYISFSLNKETPAEEADKPNTDKNTEKEDAAAKDDEKDDKKKEDKPDKEKDEKKVVKASVKVKEGTYTPQLADILVEKKIIDDDKKFIKYIDGNGYSDYLQLGTFKVNSDMTLKELGETFTTYPGN